MKLKTLKTFNNLIEAYLLKTKLEDEGVFCFLQDEYQISLNPLHSQALGGIKLQVTQDEWDKASVILNDLQKQKFTDEHGNTLECPKCSSTEFYENYRTIKDTKSILSLLFSFLLFIYPIYSKNVHKCKECGFEMEIK
ncbi:MAG TPA: DUF2007 domain-containing protein [Flavobacterium sp.]|nr:DUF2007 domain-containing protein [Flavobacterium sp.]